MWWKCWAGNARGNCIAQAHFNSIVVFDADGQDLGLYRKSHIPDGPGYQEKFYFNPGMWNDNIQNFDSSPISEKWNYTEIWQRTMLLCYGWIVTDLCRTFQLGFLEYRGIAIVSRRCYCIQDRKANPTWLSFGKCIAILSRLSTVAQTYLQPNLNVLKACREASALTLSLSHIFCIRPETHVGAKPLFRAGDTGFKVFQTRYASIGVGICWDQWYPEAARSMVLQGAEILFYPTAIGSEPHDPELNSFDHWQRVMQVHPQFVCLGWWWKWMRSHGSCDGLAVRL